MISFLREISFLHPFLLLLLIIPIGVFIWRIYKKETILTGLTLSDGSGLWSITSMRGRMKILLPIFRILAACFLIIALARPQSSFKEEEITTEGIDIVMAMDVSTSMLAKDFKPNRLEASKEVASQFISDRPNDRMGLVVFAGESFTQCPITTDHQVLKSQLLRIKNGLIEDGTAIGMGLATSINRLKESEAKSKVAIILTDGVNNRGFIDPSTAAEAAVQFGVRVYTIGVGSTGKAYSPIGKRPNGQLAYDYIDVEIDEDLLKDIARKTGGTYFRATNKESLQQIYSEIDELEKTKVEISAFMRKSEEFLPFALIGLGFLFLEILLRYTILRSFPI